MSKLPWYMKQKADGRIYFNRIWYYYQIAKNIIKRLTNYESRNKRNI